MRQDGQDSLSSCPDNGQKGMSNQVDKRTGTLKHEVHVQRERSNPGEAKARLTQPDDNKRPDVRTAPPHGGCPSARNVDEDTMGSQSVWARDWLRSVAEARLAIERARKLVEVRRERALCMGNPMGGGSGCDGTNRSEENVLALVESEDDLTTTYAWATKELREFDEMAKANRQCLRGSMLDGLDVAEMKYRIGMSDREAAKVLGISRSKLHADLAAFVDYLDYIGCERTFRPISNGDSR